MWSPSLLINAIRGTRANLTRRKQIAETVINPDIRTAVWILIEHREELRRSRSDRYTVPLYRIMNAAVVNLDTRAAVDKKRTIDNGVEAGTVGQQNGGTSAGTEGNIHIHSRDEVVVGIHDVYPVRCPQVRAQEKATDIREGVIAASGQRKEWTITTVVPFIGASIINVGKSVVTDIVKAYTNHSVQTEVRRGNIIRLPNNAIDKALHPAIRDRHVIGASHNVNARAPYRTENWRTKEFGANNVHRPTI